MIKCNKHHIMIYFIFLTICFYSCMNCNNKIAFSNVENLKTPDYSWEKDGWALNIFWIRDKGIHGVLWHDNVEIVAEKYEKIETPLGTLIYYGSIDEKQSATGWDFDGALRIGES